MEILKDFTPGETLLLRDKERVEFRDLLKLTLADLMLKKVLRWEEREAQSDPKSPIRILRYITIGKNFKTYQPLPHEEIFLNLFQQDYDIEILFNHLIRIAFENSRSRNHYIFKMVMNAPKSRPLFKVGFFNRLSHSISLNPIGESVRNEIRDVLNGLAVEFKDLIHKNRREALKVLKTIGGNVFLIENLEFELIKTLDNEMREELIENSGYGGCSGCFTFYWDSSISFDSQFDSSSGDSGCGSGCSGCSGCGGCGGCG